MVDTSFGASYPKEIVEKYSADVVPATVNNSSAAVYVGPAIKTKVRSLGVQHFAVVSEPDGTQLNEFRSPEGRTAFELAVKQAEERGMPWMESGGADVFDPASGRRWTYRVGSV